MKIDIQTDTTVSGDEPRVGNVYAVKGGRGLARGHMNVVIAITEPKDKYCCDGPKVLMLTVDRDGDPRGTTHYGLHYVRELQPIAFVDGLEDLTFVMRSL